MNRLTRANHRRAGLALCGWLPALLLSTAPSEAAELEASYSLGVAYSDNINRLPENGLSETIASAGMFLALTENTRRIRADVRGMLNYREYMDNAYDGDLVAALDGLLDVNVIDERLTWLFEENYGRVLSDPFRPETPENAENVNLFTTGPDISLFRVGRTASGITLRYSQLDYETRPLDYERRSARFWVGREIRRDQDLSVNFDIEEVELDEAIAPAFTRRSVYLRYDARLSRNVFAVEGGLTEQEISSRTSDGVRFNLTWSRQISARSQLTLNVGRSFADQGNVFRFQRGIAQDLDSVGDITETGSPFVLENAGLVYRFASERTAMSARVSASDQEYELQPDLDRRDVRVELHAQRDMSARLFATGELRFHRRNFADERDDDLIAAAAGVGLHLSPSLDLALVYTRTSRDSNTTSNEYDENRAELVLTYTPAWAR